MKTISAIALTGIVLLTALFVSFGYRQEQTGGISSELVFTGNATNTSVSVGSSLNVATNTILSANPDRSYAKICNIGATTTHACLHSTSCTFGTGIPLDVRENATTTGGCFEINRNNLYGGAIIGVVNSTSSTSTISTVER